MAFDLHEDAVGSISRFGDRASYSFNQAGLLVVVTDEGKRLTFAPHAWHHIEDQPKNPGGFY